MSKDPNPHEEETVLAAEQVDGVDIHEHWVVVDSKEDGDEEANDVCLEMGVHRLDMDSNLVDDENNEVDDARWLMGICQKKVTWDASDEMAAVEGDSPGDPSYEDGDNTKVEATGKVVDVSWPKKLFLVCDPLLSVYSPRNCLG